MTDAVIRVTYRVEGFHHWAGATGQRAYLAQPHRHLFHYTVELAVAHDDREVEFHDLLDVCKAHTPTGDLGGRSCEMLARDLVEKLTALYGDRAVSVGVMEDGEVGARISRPTRRAGGGS